MRVPKDEAAKLYFDTARFFLERVKQADFQTVEDCLAILDYPEYRKSLQWAARNGLSQVHCNAIMDAGVVHAELKLRVQMGVRT